MAAPDADAEALAADIICSLRGADLAGWTPPWRRPASAPAPRQQEGEPIWPAVVRGKRSRRRSPSTGSAGTNSGKANRWGRGSPASPLDYSGGSGSGSGASTSGGDDGGFCWPPGHRLAPATTELLTKPVVRPELGLSIASVPLHCPGCPSPLDAEVPTEPVVVEVGSIGEPRLAFSTPLPRPNGQRLRKKLKLPEVQQLVRSLEVENDSLREEMRVLQRACTALSKENDKLETKLERSNWGDENASKEQKGKEQVNQQSVLLSPRPRDSFVLPDLNLPPQDIADVPSIH